MYRDKERIRDKIEWINEWSLEIKTAMEDKKSKNFGETNRSGKKGIVNTQTPKLLECKTALADSMFIHKWTPLSANLDTLLKHLTCLPSIRHRIMCWQTATFIFMITWLLYGLVLQYFGWNIVTICHSSTLAFIDCQIWFLSVYGFYEGTIHVKMRWKKLFIDWKKTW